MESENINGVTNSKDLEKNTILTPSKTKEEKNGKSRTNIFICVLKQRKSF